MKSSLFLLVGSAAIILSACYPMRRSEPMVGPMPANTASIKRGEQLFNANCFRCHPGGEGGLAPSLNDKRAPRFLVRFQIRHGLGAMPAFGDEQLSDQDVEDIIDYMVARRRHGVAE